METELRFRAMGSDCHLIVVGSAPGLAGRAKDRIDDLESKWSRFREDSEISRLNRRQSECIRVSDDTVLLVRRAIEAWHLSGGAFDPTVLGAVVRAGYDRSFEELGPTPRAGRSLLGTGADDILIQDEAVGLPPGVGFDPGGIGKGLAADMVATEAMEGGAGGICVNMGGDMRVAGLAPNGGAWTIGIEHPSAPAPIAFLGLAEGAVATSTTLRRRWVVDREPRHHLIDPQTGLPSETDVAVATVVAAEAWRAEVLAKAVLLRGAEHPFDILGGTGAQGLIVDMAGQVQATPGLEAFLGGASLATSIAV